MHPIALLLALLLSPLLALAPPPSTPLPSGSSASNGRFSRASSSPTFPSTPLDAYVNTPDGPLLRLDRHRHLILWPWMERPRLEYEQPKVVRRCARNAHLGRVPPRAQLDSARRMNESQSSRSKWQVSPLPPPPPSTHTPSPRIPPHPLHSTISPSSRPIPFLSLAQPSTSPAVTSPSHRHPLY